MVNRPNARSRLPRVLLLSFCVACGLLYCISVRKSLLHAYLEASSEEERQLSEGTLSIDRSTLNTVGFS